MYKKVTMWLFFTMLLVPLVCFFLPANLTDSEESTVELAMPTKYNLLNKNHISNTNKYFSDRFIFKTSMLRVKTQTLLNLGQKEINGVYVTDSRLIEMSELPAEENSEKMISCIHEFSDEFDGPVYLMLIPTAAEIYKDVLPSYIPNVDEAGYITDIYNNFKDNSKSADSEKGITTLDALSPLSAAKQEQIYYNTDRRITSTGAYRIYTYNSKAMGLTSTTLLNYIIEHISYSFRGNLYTDMRFEGIDPDLINLYHYTDLKYGLKVTSRSGLDKVAEQDSIYYREKIGTLDEAAVFLGGNKPYINIDVYNSEDKEILIFSDENIGVMTQFLIPHYNKITIINLNYMSKYYSYYSDYINVDDYDCVMFMYSLSTVKDGVKFSNLDYFYND